MKFMYFTFNHYLYSLVIQFLITQNDHPFSLIKDNVKLLNNRICNNMLMYKILLKRVLYFPSAFIYLYYYTYMLGIKEISDSNICEQGITPS